MAISSRDDWLLREMRLLGSVLARMLGQKNGGQLQEALQTLDDAEGELLGVMADVAPRSPRTAPPSSPRRPGPARRATNPPCASSWNPWRTHPADLRRSWVEDAGCVRGEFVL